MKIYILLMGGVLLTIGLLLASDLPPTTSTISTQFNGACIFVEELPSPDEKIWWTGQNELHIRDENQAFNCDFNDDRLDGIYWIVVNWDVQEYFDPFYFVVGRDYGKMIRVDENGGLLWEGMRESFYTPPRKFSGQVTLVGHGEYTGLTAKADQWGDFSNDPQVQLSGNIYGTTP